MKMASSQVDIAGSAPFGCVLRDHNKRDRRRESNTHSTFQKNLKNLVRGHLHSCISISSDKKRERDQNNNVDSWVANGETNNRRSLRLKNNNDSPRQPGILDRLAAQQAREVVSTIEKQSQEPDIIDLSNSPSFVSSRASSSKREDSTAPSDSSTETSILGASSLVQIWEKRLNRLNGLKLNSTTSLSPSRSTSGFSCIEEPHGSSVEEPHGSSVEEPSSAEEAGETGDSVHERYDAPPNDDPFPDWESDRTALSDAPSSSQGRKSDAGENEKVRVADIIKRLASAYQTPTPVTSRSDDNDHGHGHSSVQASPTRDRSSLPEQMEHRLFSQAINSPRIRGRQAFTDLLMHLERDRHRELETLVERRPVSRFTQKGRIQSLIRLRLLQRGMAIRDPQLLPSTSSGVNILPQGSNIVHLRDRFRKGAEQVATAQNSAALPRSSNHQEIVNNTVDLDNSSTTNQPSERTINQEVSITEQHSTLQVQNSMPHDREDVCEEASSSSDVTSQGTRLEARNLDSQTTIDSTTASVNFWNENGVAEELEVSDHEYAESSYDWIGDISRPRSYWEGRRRERYEEVLNNTSNGEIHKLLERRTVSTFLVSDFRERIDRLMTSRLERTMHSEVEEEEEEHGSQQRTNQLMSLLQRRRHVSGSHEEEEEEHGSQERTNQLMSSLQRHRHVSGSHEEEEEEHGRQERTNQLMSSLQRHRHVSGSHEEEEEEEHGRQERTNQLMSSLQRHRHVSGSHEEEEEEHGRQERTNQLMSSLQRRRHVSGSHEEEEHGNQERTNQFMSLLQRHRHVSGSHEEEEEEDREREEARDVAEEGQEEEEDRDGADEEEEEREEEESLIGGQYNEASAYFDQSSSLPEMPSPSQLWSWTDRDNEISDDSEIVNSTSQSPQLSQPYNQDGQQTPSSRNHNSTEMELICDLRGHMEQLYHEMSELRKSIKSCMDMQTMLQQSIDQEVHSVRGEGNKSDDGAPKKGNCCICYEMQVDSLLYRCGHMCTCLKCAHELQWSNGKCPICRAPIMDVVRAYVGM